MTEAYKPDFSPKEDLETYWQEKLNDAERAVLYAKKMLAQLAIEKAEI